MMGIQKDHSSMEEKSQEVEKNKILPEGHYLRRIKEEVDFSYVYDAVQHLYAHIGRRSTDPVLLLKMQILKNLEGITSDRRLEREVQKNAGYRWFLDIVSPDDVPDHSTLSRNRNERLGRVGLYRELLDRAMVEISERNLLPMIVSSKFHAFSSQSKYFDSTSLYSSEDSKPYDENVRRTS